MTHKQISKPLMISLPPVSDIFRVAMVPEQSNDLALTPLPVEVIFVLVKVRQNSIPPRPFSLCFAFAGISSCSSILLL